MSVFQITVRLRSLNVFSIYFNTGLDKLKFQRKIVNIFYSSILTLRRFFGVPTTYALVEK